MATDDPTPMCVGMQNDLRRLFQRVQVGMRDADEFARRDGVYPGFVRDTRKKYRMDWEGWDR
jgi:hypothetical protein